jgi:hypothetical protein
MTCGHTAGGDFLGLCDKKISYKHVSNFGWLRSYDRFFNSCTRPRVNLTEPAVLSLVAYFCQLQTVQFLLSGHLEPARFTTERQPVLRPAVAFSKTSFKHR